MARMFVATIAFGILVFNNVGFCSGMNFTASGTDKLLVEIDDMYGSTTDLITTGTGRRFKLQI